ncbi:MAG: hypothetical protein UT48_C0031G0009 [Parcubacteria group bacterium GW2011_GWE2_39_37]|uniref:Uncharacterized protein n=1 Tax=Candidatus Falkowbacteria bacterium GW2011_GWF2_39_8 TaxID=1618642 RepID=A0A0G0SDQ7_9BACT|nr:MAG: hypothetical protein UT48_C0031G0009 [Parcubacteria group bacterium GW2011_GWE2_39_37]KKR32835.1 MAG: hypothetical protein UT64_C0021G0006 [Candidatus Falkowbacteria bacterium GW2011_GWF2_39_8]
MATIKKERKIDQATSETYSWWGKSFVFIKTTQVRSFHAIFILAFFVGVATAFIWSASTDLFQTVSAAEVLPKEKCVAQPNGGNFRASTTVNLKCGSKVTKAYYQWNSKPAKSFVKQIATFYYPTEGNAVLKVFGEATVQKLFFKQKVKFSQNYVFKPAIYSYPYPYLGSNDFWGRILAVDETKQKVEVPDKKKIARFFSELFN